MMKHIYPEDDESIKHISREFLKNTVATELRDYTLPTFLPGKVEPLLANQIFEKLVRRWHVRRLPEIEVEGTFEMIVCPYCCETVTLESCRIDHVIPWGKLTLYLIISEIYRISELTAAGKDLSDKGKLEAVVSKINGVIENYMFITTRHSEKTDPGKFLNDVFCALSEIKMEGFVKKAFTDESNLLYCCHRCNAKKSNDLIDAGYFDKYLALLMGEADNNKAKIEKIEILRDLLKRIKVLHPALLNFVEGDLNSFNLLQRLGGASPVSAVSYFNDFERIVKKRALDTTGDYFLKPTPVIVNKAVLGVVLKTWQDGIVVLFLSEHSDKISKLVKERPGNTGGETNKLDKRLPDEILSEFITTHPKTNAVSEFRTKLESVSAVDFMTRLATGLRKKEPKKLRLISAQLTRSGPHVLHGRICFYCFGIYEDFAFEIDHIKPVLRDKGIMPNIPGDKLNAENYLPVCKTCNASKNSCKLSARLLQRLMLKRWLNVRAPGLEHAFNVTKASETEECHEIESVFSAVIKEVIAEKRNKILALEIPSAEEISRMDNPVDDDLDA